MPLVSYDPALTLAAGAELGLLAARRARSARAITGRPARDDAALQDLRLVVVSGKGGVGRTTVAAALARAAADAGKRVLIAQTAPTDRLGRLFGRSGRSARRCRRWRPASTPST